MSRLKLSLLLLILPTVLFAQLDSVRINKNYVNKYWKDTKLIMSSPIRWEANDWKKFALITGTTAAFVFLDEPIQDAFHSFHSSGLDRFSANVLEPFDMEHSIAIMGAFTLYGAIAKDSKSYSTGLLAAESYVLASLLARIPKIVFGRKRPDAWDSDSPFEFDGPGNGKSFPSGHTTAIFSVATVIATQYADHKWVPVLSYSLASVVGLSRVYDNRHWFSDVVGGAVIGILVGKLITKDNLRKRISLVPFSTRELKGLRLALTL